MTKRLLLVLATALAMPAVAQEATPPAPDASGGLPVCSKEVRDRCIQGPAAQRLAAAEFRGGGRDNSAKMTPKQAAAGMQKPE
jgi:hypothetical protein